MKEVIPNIDINFANSISLDNRSYKVDFSLFKSLAPNYQPTKKLSDTITEIADAISNSNFRVSDFRKSYLIRLCTLNNLREKQLITSNLKWIY